MEQWAAKIIKCCYEHYGLDLETYVVQDPEVPNERSILPEELRPSQSLAATCLMSVSRKRIGSYENDDEDEEDDEQQTSTPLQAPSKRSRLYNPFSGDPTPLALRRERRKN